MINYLLVELAQITQQKIPRKCALDGFYTNACRLPGAKHKNVYAKNLNEYISNKNRRANKIKTSYWPFSHLKKWRMKNLLGNFIRILKLRMNIKL